MNEQPQTPEESLENPEQKLVNPEAFQEALAKLKLGANDLKREKKSQEVIDVENTEKMRESLELGGKFGHLHEELEIIVEALNAFDEEYGERVNKWIELSPMDIVKNIVTLGHHKKKLITKSYRITVTSSDLYKAREAIRQEMQSIVLKLDSLEHDDHGRPLEQFKEAKEARLELYGEGWPMTWGATHEEEVFRELYNQHLLEEGSQKDSDANLLEN